MKLIGLTGGIASGKSLAMAMFTKASIPVIDADDLAREVTKLNTSGYAQIVEHFGRRVLLPDSSLDRKALAQIIFKDSNERAALESIVHPLIAKEMQERVADLEALGPAFAVYCAPLIFEKGIDALFEAVILVYCDEDLQIRRLMDRDGLSKEEALQRVSAQMPLIEKQKRTKFQIDNNQSRDHTAQQLSDIWQRLTHNCVAFTP